MLYRFCIWTVESCFVLIKTWKIVMEEIFCLTSKQIQKVVDNWEANQRALKRIREEIVDVFAKEFGQMEHKMNEFEGNSSSVL